MGETFSIPASLLALLSGLYVIVGAPLPAFADPSVAGVDYNDEIKPLLSDRCYRCHGPDANQRKAGLRLDTAEGARSSLTNDRFAIFPGDPQRSEVYRRITSSDPGERMPPPESKLPPLTEDEARLVGRWIGEGAKFRSHWSLRSLEEEVAPDVAGDTWARNPIDRFVLQRLRKEGVEPSPEATREELIRRLSFDLNGLPPTLQDIDTFLNDTSERAYENLVDRLLGSNRYGERMVVEWLDLSRYSDTYGYQTDGSRRVWPWRDWVIRAFNSNMSYDQFVIEQLAGDLLPEASNDQILATAFNRLHPQKSEGGSTELEFRTEHVADRVHTFGTAFLGLTLECARCHDHKYDPVSQKEYYQLFAFFNNIDEFGLRPHFTAAVPTPVLDLAEDAQKVALDVESDAIRSAESALRAYENAPSAAFDKWLDQRPSEPVLEGLLAHFPFDSLEGGKLVNTIDAEKPASSSEANRIVEGKFGHAIELTGDDEVNTLRGNFKRNEPFTISLWIRASTSYSRAVVLHRSRAWTDAGSRGYAMLIEEGHLSASLIHFWPGNAVRVRMREALPLNRWVHVAMTHDGSSRASGLDIWLDGERADCEVVRDVLTRKISDGDKPIEGANFQYIALGARFRDRGFTGGRVDELRVYNRRLGALEIGQLYDGRSLSDALARSIDRLSSSARARLREYWLGVVDDEHEKLRANLATRRAKKNETIDGVKAIMVMRELSWRRPTYVLKRGAYDAPTEPVFAGTPASLPPLRADLPKNRLGLARWLTDPGHPLTSRVAVNRFWQMAFGEGLVRTPEDFGSQGERPTHPRLLDWLSRDFIASGWDIKALMKQIAMSATYRQSSSPRSELEGLDPENRLLARGPRHRLSAEMIRDGALAASGLLVEKIGGPPTLPYEVAWSYKRRSHAKGPDLYRRSVYTHWQRTGPAPVMMALDAAKRDICVVRRERTATPLQALVLLNAPQFAEAARVFGERMTKKHGDDVAALVEEIFRVLTARRPVAKEKDVLIALYDEQLAQFREQPNQAAAFLKVGDFVTEPGLVAEKAAAAGVVALTILNYNDSQMKS